MLQNTAILKVGGGLAAVGGTAGAGYYAHTQGIFIKSETSENESEKNYLIVRTTEHTSDIVENIYDFGIFSAKKNFLCLATTSGDTAVEYTDCEIYKLSDSEKELAKAITNNHGATNKNIKEANHYFKITSSKLIDAITKWDDSSQLISVAKLTEKAKLFGKLTPVYKVKNGEIVARKTSFLYAKVKESVGTDVSQPSATISATSKDYQCQLATTQFPCTIINLTVDTGGKKIVTVPTTDTLTSGDLKIKDKHFRIEMEEKYLKQITFNDSQTIEVIQKTNIESGKHYAKLTPLFHTIDKEISGTDSFWLLTNPTESGTGTDTTNYTDCEIWETKTKIKCDLYKFASDYADVNSVTFASELTTTNTNTDIKTGAHFVIKLTNNSSVINEIKPESKIILSSSTAGAGKVHTFTVKKRLFIDPTTASDGKLTATSVHMLDA